MNGKLFVFFLFNIAALLEAKFIIPFEESETCQVKGCGEYHGLKPGMEIKELDFISTCPEEDIDCTEYNLVLNYTIDYAEMNPETDQDVYFISTINFCNNWGYKNISNYQNVHHTKLVTPFLPETIYTQTISIQFTELNTGNHYPIVEMFQIEILDGITGIQKCLTIANIEDENTDEKSVGVGNLAKIKKHLVK